MKANNLPVRYGCFTGSQYSKGEVVLIPWSSEEGQRRLSTAALRDDFYLLANFYQPQIYPTYCGIASAVIVLNALLQPLQRAPTACYLQREYHGQALTLSLQAFLQQTLLNDKTEYIKPKAVMEFEAKAHTGDYQPGLSLDQLAAVLRHYQCQVDMHFALEEHDLGIFRMNLIHTLGDKNHFLLIHFRCDYLGGAPSGHMSPVCAYHAESDSVLVLDVAANKTPWYWVPLYDLYASMQEVYSYQVRGGGYLQVTSQ